jgi:predicted nucleic acid-binding protein
VPIVVDASVILAWFFPDEGSPGSEAVLRRVSRDGAVVPSHWAGEVANVLLTGERRRRTTRQQSERFVARLSTLPIRVDPASIETWWGFALPVAREHGLTVYDGAYLELAIREWTPLATLDDDLRTAAGRAGVGLVGGS